MNGAILDRPEFGLLTRLCRWNFAANRDERPKPLANIDWPLLVKLAKYHRVQGLAWNALAPNSDLVPKGSRETLSSDARAIAAVNLAIAVECERLRRAFERSAIPLLFLKGATLGALAYANPALKSAIDIDLLIGPADLQTAAELLRNAGYRLIAPRRHDLSTWHRAWKESVWARDDHQVDLHTRTSDNPRLIRDIGVHSPRQLVRVAEGIELPTLADEELFAYLAVHGASSAWFRLKWISDFAGFLHGRSSEELLYLYRRSQELGSGRSAGQALLLAHELFGALEGSPSLAAQLRRDATIASLFRTALGLLTGAPIEPTERQFGTFPIHRSQFQLLSGIGYKLSELSRQAMRIVTRDR